MGTPYNLSLSYNLLNDELISTMKLFEKETKGIDVSSHHGNPDWSKFSSYHLEILSRISCLGQALAIQFYTDNLSMCSVE